MSKLLVAKKDELMRIQDNDSAARRDQIIQDEDADDEPYEPDFNSRRTIKPLDNDPHAVV